MMLMRTVKQFYGPNGEKLEELELVNVETGNPLSEEEMKKELTEPEPLIVFLGILMVPVAITIPTPEGEAVIGSRPQEMRFPIEAASRKEAFEKYASAMQDAINHLKAEQAERMKQAQKQAQKPELIIPNAAQTEAINSNKLKLVH